MNFGGDVPEKDKEMIRELLKVERLIDDGKHIPSDQRAKAYTAMAHDWYSMEFEEEGHALLLKAESTYPGYFEFKIVDHMQQNEDFKVLVLSMSGKLISLFKDAFNKAGKI